MNKLIGALIGCALLSTGAAFAQSSATGTTSSAPAANSQISNTDQQYLTADAQGSVYDLSLGQLGQKSASDPNVRRYANMVVREHNIDNAKLAGYAQQIGMTLPTTLTDDERARLQTLSGQSGPAFDRAFLQEEIRINCDDVKQAEQEYASTNDPALKKLVSQFRETEQKHLARAKQLMANLHYLNND